MPELTPPIVGNLILKYITTRTHTRTPFTTASYTRTPITTHIHTTTVVIMVSIALITTLTAILITITMVVL